MSQRLINPRYQVVFNFCCIPCPRRVIFLEVPIVNADSAVNKISDDEKNSEERSTVKLDDQRNQ